MQSSVEGLKVHTSNCAKVAKPRVSSGCLQAFVREDVLRLQILELLCWPAPRLAYYLVSNVSGNVNCFEAYVDDRGLPLS